MDDIKLFVEESVKEILAKLVEQDLISRKKDVDSLH